MSNAVSSSAALLARLNDQHRDWPSLSPIHKQVAAIAAQQADQVAVYSGQRSLSYRQLDDLSAALAGHLLSVVGKTNQATGVDSGQTKLIAVAVQRDEYLPVILLAVWRAGFAYVPIDPEYPAERIAYILQQAQVALLITDELTPEAQVLTAMEPLAGQVELPHLRLSESLLQGVAPFPALELPTVDLSQTAYVIYTSGSTGRPKGVVISHRAAANFILAMAERPACGADDCLLAVTTLAFDIALLEIFLPLSVGARLVIAQRRQVQDGQTLAQLLVDYPITMMQATPSGWRLLLQAGWHSVPGFKMLCGGEALGASLAAQLLQGGGELWNMYGPTETTVWSSCQRVEDAALIDLGKPIANTEFYLFCTEAEALGEPAQINQTAELYIAGEGVAEGYLHNPELTAERFIQRPNYPTLYRTGDLVRLDDDGRLLYLGRADFQVKIRGFRIELAELEHCLERFPGVRQGVALAFGQATQAPYIDMVYTADEAIDWRALRTHMAASLPDYMVPRRFYALDRLPLTPNLKVDRKALMQQLQSFANDLEHAAEPVIAQEDSEPAAKQYLRKLWAESLQLAPHDIDGRDSFFDLGGTSLQTMQALAQLKADWGWQLEPRRFMLSSFDELANRLALETPLTVPAGSAKPSLLGRVKRWFGG